MASTKLRPVLRVTVHCPITPETLQALAAGSAVALARDPGVAPILDLIESSAEFGDFGRYKGVCEIALGLEAFTPQAGAQPTVGSTGARSISPTATVKTYLAADCPPARLEALIASLATRHPWEVPVIEVTDARLLDPTAQAGV